MSDDRIHDEWHKIAAKVQGRWRKLTIEDVLVPHGSAEYLAERLQRRYGVDRGEALLQVFEFESGL